MAPLPVAVPSIWIGRRGAVAAESVGPITSIDSERFASIFTVRASDPAIAKAMLDPSMEGWLLSGDHDIRYEVRGRTAFIISGRRIKPDDLDRFLNLAIGFAQRLPRWFPVQESSSVAPARPDSPTR
jgi:hypothetical protein